MTSGKHTVRHRGAFRSISLSIQYVSKIRTEYGRISQPQKLQFGSTSLEYHRATVEVYFLSAGGQVTPALFHDDPGKRRLANRKL